MDTISPPTPNNNDPKEDVKFGLARVWSGIKKFWFELTDLQKGLDREGTIVNIRNNMRMQGANAWTLMCSIMIASLGLDLNSPAVIIGAMLISPLMSPILGVGLSIGINDYNSLKISFRHIGVSIGIALFTSTLYFLITPFGDFTSEISNRTAPTFLDAAVALFGGIAGIISGSQKDKSNAIPGVAIATALMPPLCVSGFGIANMIKSGLVNESFTAMRLNNLEITLNSFYLFFLNATLVALATFFIVRLLRFPIKALKDQSELKRKNLLLVLFSFVIIIPSIFIFISVLNEVEEQVKIKDAIAETFSENQTLIDDWKVIPRDSSNSILAVKVYSSSLGEQRLKDYSTTLAEKLPDLKIAILPTADVNTSDLEALNERIADVEKLDSLVSQLSIQKETKKSAEILALEYQLDVMTQDTLLMQAVSQELQSLFSKVIDTSYYFHPSMASDNPPTIIVDWKSRRDPIVRKQIIDFVKTRAKVDEVLFANQ